MIKRQWFSGAVYQTIGDREPQRGQGPITGIGGLWPPKTAQKRRSRSSA